MMRCMTAICPAGPPKLSAATRSQTRKASPKVTPCECVDAPLSGVAWVTALLMSASLFRGRPVVRFVRGVAAPAVEGIIEQHAGIQLLEVVDEHARQAERG